MTAYPSQYPIMTDVDSLVKQNRAATPVSVAEKRKVPRFSISEINEQTLDDLKDHFSVSGFDNRSPLTKVLDLVDLPRNAVANIVFRTTGLAGQGENQRTGAFGLPVVTTSDALESLGIKNHLVRGIAGFVGDVALDPLTYLGPAGWGLEVMDNAGRAVRIGKAGAQGLKQGIKAVEAGGQIAHAPTADLFRTLLEHAPDEIKAGDNAAKAAYLSEKALGKVGSESKAGQAFGYLSRTLGGDAKAKGGAIASALGEESPIGDAARAFVGQAGAAAGPGIGQGGSQVAHIPFTGISAKVPAFTKAGRAVEEDLALARSAAPRPISDVAPASLLRAGQLAKEIDNAIQHNQPAEDLYRELSSLVNNRTEAEAIRPQNPREIFQLEKLRKEAEAGMNASYSRVRAAHNQYLPEELADASNMPLREHDESFADSLHDTFKAYQKYHEAVNGAVRNFAELTPQEDMLVRQAQRFLGTDDRIIGRAAFAGPEAMAKAVKAPDFVNDLNARLYRAKTSIFGERGSALNEAARELSHAQGSGQRRAVNSYLGDVSRQIQQAFEESGIRPTTADMEEATSLLSALAIKKQAAVGEAAGREVYYTTRFGSKELSPFLQHIQNAATSGKLADHLNGGLMARLEQIAETHGSNLLKELQDIETNVGILKDPRLGYFPNTPTPAGQAAISRSKAYGDLRTPQGRARVAAAEAFQKPRSMDQIRWTDPLGKERRMFAAELDQARHYRANPQELEALDREGYGHVAEALRQNVDDLNSLEMAYPKGDIPWHATDPFEMNQLAKDGRFSMLLDGNDPVGGFMQTNMLAAMANRIGAHERAMANASWSKYVEAFGLKAPDFKGAIDKSGTKIIASDGSVARITTAYDSRGHRVKAATIGGKTYRPVQGVKENNPLIQMLGPESATTLYPEQVASAIERVAETFDAPEKLQAVLDGINTFTKQWKQITLLHPGWTIFNMIGDTMNAISNGANARHLFDPEKLKFAIALTKNADNPEKLRNMAITIRGQRVTGEELLNQLIEHKAIDGTMMEDQAVKMVENKIFALPAQGSGRLGKLMPSALSSDYKDAMQRYAIARGHDTATLGDKLKAGGSVAGDRYLSNIIGPWFRMNQKMSNTLRTNVMMAYLEDGYDVGAAARKTIESQFDYSDATKAESVLFRTLFPFYSWMRNNGAFQIKKALESPVYAASFPKLRDAIEEAIAGDEKVPQNLRPTWMRNALALQLGSNPESRSAILLGGALPAADVYQYLTPITGEAGAMDFLHYFSSGLNPAINIPLQLGNGAESFSGRTIGADQYSGDMSAGEFLKDQIRPLAEVGKIGKAFSQGGIGAAAGRLLVGGRLQDFSQSRIDSTRAREFKDKQDRIRQAIQKAERNGDKARSLQGRVKLMELYNWAMQNGLEESVPKWAKPQLEQLAGSAQ